MRSISVIRLECLQQLWIVFYPFGDCVHHSRLQAVLVQCRGVLAVLFSVLQSVHTAPHDPLLPFCRPGASAVGTSTLAADQKVTHGVLAGIFALQSFVPDFLSFHLGRPPCQFLLHLSEGFGIDDRRVAVLDIVFRALPCVHSNLLADAVLDVGLAEDGIALISFVGEDRPNRPRLPMGFPARGADAVIG